MTDTKKQYREFWVYEGKNNCVPLLLVYLRSQHLKRLAPENFDEFHVVEHEALTAAEAEIADLSARIKVYEQAAIPMGLFSKIMELEKERDQVQADSQAQIDSLVGQIFELQTERNDLKAKLGVAIKAMKEVVCVCNPKDTGERQYLMNDHEYIKKVMLEALSKIKGGEA